MVVWWVLMGSFEPLNTISSSSHSQDIQEHIQIYNHGFQVTPGHCVRQVGLMLHHFLEELYQIRHLALVTL